MTIDEAIKILQHNLAEITPSAWPDTHASLTLGIEALKRVREQRTGYENYAPDLLPGETPQ